MVSPGVCPPPTTTATLPASRSPTARTVVVLLDQGRPKVVELLVADPGGALQVAEDPVPAFVDGVEGVGHHLGGGGEEDLQVVEGQSLLLELGADLGEAVLGPVLVREGVVG